MTGLSALDAITGRRSVRRFLPDAVPEETVRAILTAASRAASGTNIQPWNVHVVTGGSRDRLSRAVLAVAEAGETSPEYAYEPGQLWEPYLARRRKVGFDLYAKYGIERTDMLGRKAAMLRNFTFFGAPVGLFFTMERALTQGSWLDCGMFMQNVMIAARAFGLETCPQQAWTTYGAVVHRHLAIPESHLLLSGMALGREDKAAPENTLATERADLDDFVTWHD
jgi:nitroreductase